MMSENEARSSLEKLVHEYLESAPVKLKLVEIIRDKSRPGLPIRGVLEEMRKYREKDYTVEDKNLIDELIYLYG